jgi:hypothetical protein
MAAGGCRTLVVRRNFDFSVALTVLAAASRARDDDTFMIKLFVALF